MSHKPLFSHALYTLFVTSILFISSVARADNDDPDRYLMHRSAMFAVHCNHSHTANDDPIVHPNDPGGSHEHEFFGNTGTNAFSTPDKLQFDPSQPDAGTTCGRDGIDRSAYWVPAMYRDGIKVRAVSAGAYYTTNRKANVRIQTIPQELVMVAGHHSTQPQGLLSWNCGHGTTHSSTLPHCQDGKKVHMHVKFPDCWDGIRMDEPDNHRTHMAYAQYRGYGAVCPDSHPVPIPRLILRVIYDTDGDPEAHHELTSGPIHSGHADFMNGFDETELELLIDRCLRSGTGCGHGQPFNRMPGAGATP